MTRRCTRCPRGTSLVELLAVLTGLGVAMAVATGLLHTGMRQQSLSRQELERDRTAMRLARDFREDVRQASAVVLDRKGDAGGLGAEAVDGSLVQLALTDGVVIAYQTTRQGITRLHVGESRRIHEDYVFGVPMDWRVERDHGCLVLVGTTPNTSDQPHMQKPSPPLDIRVVAAITTEPQATGSVAEEVP